MSSVMIPTYNCAKYIGQAIESVWAQDVECEIIIVDDGSTDETRKVIAELSEKRQNNNIKYFYKEHSGISPTRNLCLQKASGDYLAFLDSDDYYLPGKLKAQLEFLKANPTVGLVFTRYRNFVDGEDVSSDNVRHEMGVEKVWTCLPSALIRKEVFARCGNFDESLEFAEDTDFLFRLEIVFDMNINNFVDEVYYMRRLHQKNKTMTLTPQQLAYTAPYFILHNRDKKAKKQCE